MITKRIALLIAPWGLVLFLAIGCSRQEAGSDRSGRDGSGRRPVSAIPRPATDPDFPAEIQAPSQDRYAALLESNDGDPRALSRALAPFYNGWGARDGEAAVAHAMAQNRPMVKHAFAGWLASDDQAAREFVLSQPGPGRRRGSLAAGLLHALPRDGHAARAEWAEQFAGEPSAARLVSEVAIGWGRERPEEALAWLERLPGGSARSGGIETIFRHWTEADPEGASRHLTRMAAGDAKDLAISSLAKSILDSDPEAARLWAGSIVDPAMREVTNGLLDRLAQRAAPPEL